MNIKIIRSWQQHTSAEEARANSKAILGFDLGADSFQDRDSTMFEYELDGERAESGVDHANATETEMIEAVRASREWSEREAAAELADEAGLTR